MPSFSPIPPVYIVLSGRPAVSCSLVAALDMYFSINTAFPASKQPNSDMHAIHLPANEGETLTNIEDAQAASVVSDSFILNGFVLLSAL